MKLKLWGLLFCVSVSLFCIGCTSESKANAAGRGLDPDSIKVSDNTSVKVSHSGSNTLPEERSEKLTLAFTGDIMGGTTYPEGRAFLPADNGKHLFDACEDILKETDIAAGNCEGAICTGGEPKKCQNPDACYIFRQPPYMAKVFADAGFKFMNLANNHSNDFGESGQRQTVEYLEDAGIEYAGIKNKKPYAVIETGGRKVGFVCFGAGGKTPSINDYSEMTRLVKELASKSNIVVVSMHAGAEGPKYSRVPKASEVFYGEQRGNVWKFAHDAIDAGADIVWGHGPHVPRAMELYKDRIIMYSLGNFCTPFRMGISGVSGQAPLVTVEIDGEGRFSKGKIHSFLQRKGRGPVLDHANGAALTIKKLSSLDFPSSRLRISQDGELTCP